MRIISQRKYSQMEKNPFKFGSIVEEPYFTNRTEEIQKVKSVLNSENHLIVISPRRYGKTSLINKVVKELKRSFILLDLQLITSAEDFAAQLLKRAYKIFPLEKIKQLIKSFRIIPSVSINPVTGELDVSFRPSASSSTSAIEDVLNLIEKLSPPNKKIIIVFDEFQEVKRIDKELDRHLRAFMQHHKNINHVFLGSQESLIRDIFEKKKSPFYHFGFLFPLSKIPADEFHSYLSTRFQKIIPDHETISWSIIQFTGSHPYYTQQLAFAVWEVLSKNGGVSSVIESAINELIQYHDADYERLWNTLNRTDMKILIGMSFTESSPLSENFLRQYHLGAASTVFSSIKRLLQNGFLVKSEIGYELDDPFFKRWIRVKRSK